MEEGGAAEGYIKMRNVSAAAPAVTLAGLTVEYFFCLGESYPAFGSKHSGDGFCVPEHSGDGSFCLALFVFPDDRRHRAKGGSGMPGRRLFFTVASIAALLALPSIFILFDHISSHLHTFQVTVANVANPLLQKHKELPIVQHSNKQYSKNSCNDK